ncbi:hypothetical protein [Spiroplasma endosymbiont of Polydrusus formosus]|uniref:hypothetical protein n=1 Tax=Spiroplasma endosymbiont of Polydrusus formosus TaxID=3139326 RepID=UPI0035B528AF
MYYKSHYDRSDSKDYINCSMTKNYFDVWVQALITEDTVTLYGFEKEIYFE